MFTNLWSGFHSPDNLHPSPKHSRPDWEGDVRVQTSALFTIPLLASDHDGPPNMFRQVGTQICVESRGREEGDRQEGRLGRRKRRMEEKGGKREGKEEGRRKKIILST